MLKIILFLTLLSLSSGCNYQASTKIGGTNILTPYGKADSINAERNTEIGVK